MTGSSSSLMVGHKVGAAKIITFETNHIIIDVNGQQKKLSLAPAQP
ncbi:MAG: hypothetical protein ACO1QS_05040 [Verrucomicrobiota bacterium]